LLLEPADLHRQPLALGGVLAVALLVPEALDLLLQLGRGLGNPAPELLGLGPELLVGERLELLVDLVDLVDERLELLGLTLVARAEKGFQGGLEQTRTSGKRKAGDDRLRLVEPDGGALTRSTTNYAKGRRLEPLSGGKGRVADVM